MKEFWSYENPWFQKDDRFERAGEVDDKRRCSYKQRVGLTHVPMVLCRRIHGLSFLAMNWYI